MKRLLQHWLTEQTERKPDKTAVTMGDQKLSYAELEVKSNQLAHMLKESGYRKNDRIAFLMPKSPEAYISIFGILKADCIYVPLDPDGPVIRSGKMIKKAGARMILSTKSAADKAKKLMLDESIGLKVQIGMLDDQPSDSNFDPVFSFGDLESLPATPPDYKNNPENTAHILFTSGSTGEPKGVLNTHSNVIHFIQWADDYFGINSTDRISGHPPLHFDMSSLDIYTSVSSGAELYPVPVKMNIIPNLMVKFIRDNRLTQWFSVPSVLSLIAKFDLLKENDFPEMKRLMWCGEVMPTSTLIYLMKRCPHVQITNLYGPTETTIASSYYTVPECPEDETKEIPIGQPCEGESLYVLDESLNKLQPEEKGDLYISGVGVGQGYWKDPEKTKEVFLNHPFSSNPEERIYKTGDIARLGKNGLFYFHGRSDSQIKSRGYRIELGEVENAVNSLSGILETAVVAVPTDDFDGKAICCAFVSVPDKQSDIKVLRSELNEILPDYMIPTKWEEFGKLPKNKNGKIDRKKIAENFTKNATKVS